MIDKLKKLLPDQSKVFLLDGNESPTIESDYDFIVSGSFTALINSSQFLSKDIVLILEDPSADLTQSIPSNIYYTRSHRYFNNFQKRYFHFFRKKRDQLTSYSLSVIIPCKDEAQNILQSLDNFPQFDNPVEIIYCIDPSTDGSLEIAKSLKAPYENATIKVINGPDTGKSSNVWNGFDIATGDILAILDGDLTIPSAELKKCYDILTKESIDFINTTRTKTNLLTSKEMPLFNFWGNNFFAFLFSLILKQKLTDTLAGTKLLWRKDYLRIKPGIGRWQIKDKWGDFELLLGASTIGLKIQEVPVQYVSRTYGQSKMNKRLSNGLRMATITLSALLFFAFL
jgi:hypothetical protein